MEQILVSDGHYVGTTSGSSQVSIHLDTPRRPAMGQESVE